MKDLLYRKLKEHLVSTLRAMLLFMGITSFLFFSTLLTYFDVISIVELNEQNKLIILIFTAILEAGAIVGTLVSMIPYACDYQLIKKEKFKVIHGIVNRFEFYMEGTEPPTTYAVPVIEDLHTGEILKTELDQNVEIGDRCLICFLPRTKIAVWVNNDS